MFLKRRPKPNPSPAEPAVGSVPAQGHFLRFLIPVLLLLLATWGGLQLQRAWRQTRIREASLGDLQAMARQDPDDAPLRSLLGAKLAEARQYGPAIAALKHAIAEGDNDPLVWLTMAGSAAAAGSPPIAVGMLKVGSEKGVPGLARASARVTSLGKRPAPLAVAEAILPSGAAELARSRSRGSFLNPLSEWWGRLHPESSGDATREDWASQQPNNPLAQRLWGEALTEDGNLFAANQVLTHALALAPQSPEVHLDLGNLDLLEQQIDDASQQYQTCLKLRPDWPPALVGAGKVALMTQITPSAISFFQRATQVDPKSVEAWVGLGTTLTGDPLRLVAALDAFRHAQRLAPDRTDYFDAFSDALRANYKADEAEDVLRRRIHDAPEDWAAHFLLGKLLVRNHPSPERSRQAEQEIRFALTLSPHNPDIEIELANLLIRKQEPRQAIVLLKNAISADPLNSPAASALAQAYQEAGDASQASAATDRALKLQHYNDTLSLLQNALKIHSGDLPVHKALVRLYQMTRQPEKARLEQAIIAQLEKHPLHGTQDALRVPGLSPAPLGAGSP